MKMWKSGWHAVSAASIGAACLAVCACRVCLVNDVAVFQPEVIPVEDGAVQNAGCGTEIWNGGAADGVTNLVRYAVRVSPHSVNAMIRVGWDAYESGPGEYHFEKMDAAFARCSRARVRAEHDTR